jgi:hypothetical protein
MIGWFLQHGATVLIALGGILAAVSAFISERRTSEQRELGKKGFWPTLILLGTVIAVSGALWAGYGQDMLFDYLSGGDSYGFVTPVPQTGTTIPLIFTESGKTPLYDVSVDLIDVTKNKVEMAQQGIPSPEAQSQRQMSVQEWSRFWKIWHDTRTSINLGNITPGSAHIMTEVPVPASDVNDQRYEFAIWARNGFFSEQLLMHRLDSGWVWAWRVERTSPEVNHGKPEKIDEQVMTGFPPDKLEW